MNPYPIPSRRAVLAIGAGACLAALWQPGLAEAAAPLDEFQAAFQLFSKASGGDNGAVDGAAEAFSKLSAQHPADAVLLAYAGAATAMRGRTTLLPWRKMSHAEAGLAQLDKALALLGPADDAPRYRGTPASLETRFVAAGTFLALPTMFNRHARGEKLLQQVLTSPLLDTASASFQTAVRQRAEVEQAKRKEAAQ